MAHYKTVDFYVHWRTQYELEAKSGFVFLNLLWTACRLESQSEGCGTQSPGRQRSTDPVVDSSIGRNMKARLTISKQELANRQTNNQTSNQACRYELEVG